MVRNTDNHLLLYICQKHISVQDYSVRVPFQITVKLTESIPDILHILSKKHEKIQKDKQEKVAIRHYYLHT